MKTKPTIGDVMKEVRNQGSKTDQRFEDVLKEVHAQGAKTDQRFEDVMASVSDLAEAVGKGFSAVQEDIEGLRTDVGGLRTEVGGLTARVTRIEAVMVTKDYLDERLGRSDGRFNTLINVLEKKSVITTEDKSAVLA